MRYLLDLLAALRGAAGRQILHITLLFSLALAPFFVPSIRNLDYSTLLFAEQMLYVRESEPPLVLIAVDAAMVERFGCPPYSNELLSLIDARLAELGINQILLADGAQVWFKTTEAPSLRLNVQYLAPTVLYWDTYEKRWSVATPNTVAMAEPINAFVLMPPSKTNTTMYEFPPESADPELLGFELMVPLYYWLASHSYGAARMPHLGELVQFAGPAGTAPTLPLSRILDGEFAPQDLKGKTPVLGVTAAACRGLVAVPTDRDGMSSAEVLIHQATTLSKPPVVRLGLLGHALLVALLLVGTGLIAQLFEVRGRLLLIAAVAAAAQIVGLVALYLLRVQLPTLSPVYVSALAVADTTLAFLTETHESAKFTLGRVRSVLEPSAYLPQALSSVPFETMFQRYMRQLAELIGCKAAAFFYLPAELFHMRFVAGYQMTEQDVWERRRDIRRFPWVEVIATGKRRPLPRFLRDAERGESYGIAIERGGNLLGILAIVVDKGHTFSEEDDTLLLQFASYFAEVVPIYQREFEGDILQRRILSRLLERSPLRATFGTFTSMVQASLVQILQYKTLLDSVDFGVGFADVLGNLYYQNSPAQEALKDLEIEGERSIHAILAHVSGSADQASEMIKQAVALAKPPPIEKRSPSGRLYAVSLVGIPAIEERREERAPAAVALQLVLQDITRDKELDRLKSQILYLASFKGKNMVTGLVGLLQILEFSAGEQLKQMLAAPIEQLTKLSHEFEEMFDKFSEIAEKLSETHAYDHAIAFDLPAVVESVIESLKERLESRNVEVALQAPMMCAPALGNWDKAREGLEMLLSELVGTSAPGSKIELTITEEPQGLVLKVLDRSLLLTEELAEIAKRGEWEALGGGIGAALKVLSQAEAKLSVEPAKDSTGAVITLEFEKL